MISSMGGSLCISGWSVQASVRVLCSISVCCMHIHVYVPELVSVGSCFQLPSLSVTRAYSHPTQRLPEGPRRRYEFFIVWHRRVLAVWKSYEVLNILDGNLMMSSVSYTHTCPCSSTGNSPKGRRLHAHLCVHE
jgi:hypothetical protein